MDWLTEAVESVLQQNYDNIEIIVIMMVHQKTFQIFSNDLREK